MAKNYQLKITVLCKKRYKRNHCQTDHLNLVLECDCLRYIKCIVEEEDGGFCKESMQEYIFDYLVAGFVSSKELFMYACR
jgi:hypothetical protein